MKTNTNHGSAENEAGHHEQEDHKSPIGHAKQTGPKKGGETTIIEKPKELTPAEVYRRETGLHRPSLDSMDARNRYSDTLFIAREKQADFLVKCYANGSYIRNRSGVEEANARHFRNLHLGWGTEIIHPCATYMSRLLATFDGAENPIQGTKTVLFQATGFRGAMPVF